MIASDTRTGADGADRRMVVGVAGVNGDYQVREAILGIGVFRLTDGACSKEILDPAVTGAGTLGVYGGAVSFIDGGPLGHLVHFESSDMHMR